MKTTINIERSEDLFTAYATDSVDGYTPAGYGQSVEEAIADLNVCIAEMNELRAQENLPPFPSELDFRYDIESFFNKFSYLIISKVAQLAGINPSLMRQYASGLTKAGQKQYDKIRTAVNCIVRELSAATF